MHSPSHGIYSRWIVICEQHLLVLPSSSIFAEQLKRVSSPGEGEKNKHNRTPPWHLSLSYGTAPKLAPQIPKREHLSACTDSCNPNPCLASIKAVPEEAQCCGLTAGSCPPIEVSQQWDMSTSIETNESSLPQGTELVNFCLAWSHVE